MAPCLASGRFDLEPATPRHGPARLIKPQEQIVLWDELAMPRGHAVVV